MIVEQDDRNLTVTMVRTEYHFLRLVILMKRE